MSRTDTLHAVALRHGLPLHRLLAINPGLVGLDHRNPQPGWILDVPGEGGVVGMCLCVAFGVDRVVGRGREGDERGFACTDVLAWFYFCMTRHRHTCMILTAGLFGTL